MPDWSYRTVFRPLLFRLPLATARDLCLGFMGQLARLPLGCFVIDFLGHMRPDPRLRTNWPRLTLAGPVVLGPHLDPQLLAPRALARFGVGMIEIGPVARRRRRRHAARFAAAMTRSRCGCPIRCRPSRRKRLSSGWPRPELTVPVVARLAAGPHRRCSGRASSSRRTSRHLPSSRRRKLPRSAVHAASAAVPSGRRRLHAVDCSPTEPAASLSMAAFAIRPAAGSSARSGAAGGGGNGAAVAA